MLVKTVGTRQFYNRKIIIQALNDFELADAYWISPDGMVRSVISTHIEDVIKSPTDFGLTYEYVKDRYDEYGEKFPVEELARGIIIDKIILNGWIRIRYERRQNLYNVEVFILNEKIREYLCQWAFAVMAKDEGSENR
jgi:hypothetical protein